jgi:hypothetical protein
MAAAETAKNAASATEIAESLLAAAIARDAGKPLDDMSVVALSLREHQEELLIRRMHAEVPLPSGRLPHE